MDKLQASIRQNRQALNNLKAQNKTLADELAKQGAAKQAVTQLERDVHGLRGAYDKLLQARRRRVQRYRCMLIASPSWCCSPDAARAPHKISCCLPVLPQACFTVCMGVTRC